MYFHTFVADFDFLFENSKYDAETNCTNLHEARDATGNDATNFRVFKHYLPIACPRDSLPIGFYMIYTIAYIVFTKQQHGVIEPSTKAITYRAKRFQFWNNILFNEGKM